MKHKAPHSISTVIEWSPSNASSYASQITKSAETVGELGVGPSNGSGILVAVSRRTVFVKSVRVPNSSESEIRQILRVQLDQLFPVEQGELAYDLWLTSNITAEGRLAVVCGIKADVLRSLQGQLAKASIRPTKILPASLGSVLLARSLGQKDCVVVDSTQEGLAIDIISGGELRYSRVAPQIKGSTDAKAEIARAFSIAGVEPSLVIAAGNMKLAGADIEAQQSTLSMLTTPQALGLNVNIEPPEAAEERTEAKIRGRLRFAALLVVAACVLWVRIGWDAADRQTYKQKVESKWGEKVSKLQNAKKLAEASSKNASNTLVVLKRGFEPAQKLGDVMAIVSNSTPNTAWLSGMTLQRGKQLSLRGTALSSESVTTFAKNLNQQKRLRDVKLVFATNGLIEATPIVQFSITGHIIGNLPLSEKDMNKSKK